MKPFFHGILVLFCFIPYAHGESLSVQQVIERVLHHYPSIRTAALRVEVAQQETDRINSQLAWQLNAGAGYRHDFSLFGSPSNRMDLQAGLSRKLASGDQLELSANYSRDKSDVPISPFYPNPASNASVELNYRMPLQKGRDNIVFNQSLASAEINAKLSQWQLRALLDKLAAQVIDLYYGYAVTQVRMENNRQSISRTEKLKKYLHKRAQLGISEDKDILQVDAQLKSQQAQLQAVQLQADQQKISLNHLMNRNWQSNIEINKKSDESDKQYRFNDIYKQILLTSADIQKLNEKIKLADKQISIQQDKKKDQLDLVLFIGDKNLSGDVQAGYINENEVVGGARLEYKRGLDLSGYDAAIYQARLQRDIALQNKKQIMEDLKYQLAGLLSAIASGKKTLQAYTQSVQAQKQKLREAQSRYRDGRSSTDQIILFENQLSAAMLARDLQSLEIQKQALKVSLLQGKLWQQVSLPDIQSLIKREQ